MSEPKRRGIGEFFAVDYGAWPAVCELGLNAATAYVVLARFSGRDNTHTAASVQAIEAHTGMARERAKEAIATLIKARLVELVPESPRTRPRYLLRAWGDVYRDRTPEHATTIKHAPQASRYTTKRTHYGGGQRAWPTKETDIAAAARAGMILRSQDSWEVNAPGAERDLAWMPNAFVTGAGSEVPPLRRLRETGTVDALRLVVDLYAAHHLVDDGGVSCRVVWQPWERHVIAVTEDYNVLGFTRPKRKDGSPNGGAFNTLSRAWNGFSATGGKPWDSMRAVERLGLVEVVTTLFDGPDGEPVFPVHHEGSDTDDARAINACGHYAIDAARAWGSDAVAQWEAQQRDYHLLMAPRHMTAATLRGVYRLRYRPRTNATARWWGKLRDTTETWTRKFNELAEHTQHDRRSSG